MILRKRAWDMVRDKFFTVEETGTLLDAINAFEDLMAAQPDGHTILVTDKAGGLRGTVSIWDLLRFINDFLLDRDLLKEAESGGFDDIFKRSCQICASTPLAKLVDTKVQVLKPTEPLILILEDFLKGGRSLAVVQEAGKILGVIHVNDLYLEISRGVASHH